VALEETYAGKRSLKGGRSHEFFGVPKKTRERRNAASSRPVRKASRRIYEEVKVMGIARIVVITVKDKTVEGKE